MTTQNVNDNVFPFGSYYQVKVTSDRLVVFSNKKKNSHISLTRAQYECFVDYVSTIKEPYPKRKVTNINGNDLCVIETEFMDMNYIGLFRLFVNGNPDFSNGTNILTAELFDSLTNITTFVQEKFNILKI